MEGLLKIQYKCFHLSLIAQNFKQIIYNHSKHICIVAFPAHFHIFLGSIKNKTKKKIQLNSYKVLTHIILA